VYIKTDRIKAVYKYDVNTLDPNDIDESDVSDGKLCIGICSWKLFDMSMHIVPKDTGYLEGLWPTIDKAARTVRECFKVDTLSPAAIDSCYNTIMTISDMYSDGTSGGTPGGKHSSSAVKSSRSDSKIDYSIYGEYVEEVASPSDMANTDGSIGSIDEIKNELDKLSIDTAVNAPVNTAVVRGITVGTIKRIEPRIDNPDKIKVIKYYLVRKCLDALREPIDALLNASFHNNFMTISLASSVRQSVISDNMTSKRL